MPNRLSKGRVLVGQIVGDIQASAGSIGSTELAASAVTTAKIASGAVTSVKTAHTITTLSASTTISNQGVNILNNSTADAAVVATVPAPVAGAEYVLTCTSYSTAGSDSVKFKLAGGSFVGQNSTLDVAVMNAAGDLLDIIAISTAQYLIQNNVGSVSFAAST